MRISARGWGMLGAGVATAALAAALASVTTARIATLLLALPLCALAWALVVRALGGRRRVERTISPATWQVGRPGTVELAVAGRATGPWSTLRERVPSALARQPEGPRRYGVLPRRRGRYTLGPAVMRSADPFALVTWAQDIGPATDVLVWPPTEPLDAQLLASAMDAIAPHTHGTPRRTLEDLTVREYRHGDDLHRVHWRSTARHGELMVRHDEPTTTQLLDLLVLVGADDDLGEWAVGAAASVAEALMGAGASLRLVAVVDGVVVTEECLDAADALDLLAVVGVADAATALEAARRVSRSAASGVVAVLDRADEQTTAALRPVGNERTAAALVTGPGCAAASHRLRSSGWRAAQALQPVPVATAWGELVSDRVLR